MAGFSVQGKMQGCITHHHRLYGLRNRDWKPALCAVLALPVTDTDLATGEEGGKARI